SAPVVVGGNLYVTRRADQGKGKAEEAVAGYDRLAGKQQFQGDKKTADYLDGRVQDRSQLKQAGAKLGAGNGFANGAPAAANARAAWDNVGQGNVCTLQAFQGSRLLHLAGRNFNCMGDEVVCSDARTGKSLWTYKLAGDLRKEGGFLAAPPAAAGGHL